MFGYRMNRHKKTTPFPRLQFCWFSYLKNICPGKSLGRYPGEVVGLQYTPGSGANDGFFLKTTLTSDLNMTMT